MNDNSSKLLDRALCIICQSTKGGRTSSTENGRARIKHAANLRRDDVFHRLNLLSPNGK